MCIALATERDSLMGAFSRRCLQSPRNGAYFPCTVRFLPNADGIVVLPLHGQSVTRRDGRPLLAPGGQGRKSGKKAPLAVQILPTALRVIRTGASERAFVEEE